MKAQCYCREDRGTCCVACRAALELATISARLVDRAPAIAEKAQALAVELRRELAEDRAARREYARL